MNAKNDYNLFLSLFKTALVRSMENWKFDSHLKRVAISMFSSILDILLWHLLMYATGKTMMKSKTRAFICRQKSWFLPCWTFKHKYAAWNQLGCGRSSNGICAKSFFFLSSSLMRFGASGSTVADNNRLSTSSRLIMKNHSNK